MKRFRIAAITGGGVIVIACWLLTLGAWRYDRVRLGLFAPSPREEAELTLVVLGSGGAHADPYRRGPALAALFGKHALLVDAGRGVSDALRLAEIPARQIDTLLLTNLLSENTLGLDELLFGRWLDGAAAPLRIVGPPGSEAAVVSLVAALRSGVMARADALGLDAAHFAPRVVEADGAWSETRDGLALRAAALHGGPLPALAWRIEAGERSLAIGTSAWGRAELIELARGADLLVHDAQYIPTPEEAAENQLEVTPEQLAGEARLHSRLTEVGDIAQEAGVESLLLLRLRPAPVLAYQVTSLVGDRFGGRILVAQDAEEIRP